MIFFVFRAVSPCAADGSVPALAVGTGLVLVKHSEC